MKSNILSTLMERTVIGDGALGTQLHARGIDPATCCDELNILNPDIIREIHGEYLAAGAELIETNTFGANRSRLSRWGLGEKAFEINRLGARIARECAGDRAWVAGAMGPLGRTEGEAADSPDPAPLFKEQAKGLVSGGVDLILLETFTSLSELLSAISAVRGVTELPVIAQLTFAPDGQTLAGDRLDEAFAALIEAGADGVGANCGMGPQGFCSLMETAGRELPAPLSLFPNAGFPERRDGRLVYLTDPDYFSDAALRLVARGARLIGGCCGTTPAHIHALSRKVRAPGASGRGFEPRRRQVKREAAIAPDTPPSSSPAGRSNEPRFIVELDPPKTNDISHVLEAAAALGEAGVDFISLAENPLGIPRLCNIQLSGIIRRRLGIETIVHITGRDRNRIGLQSTLMGLHAAGERNVLAVTGDPPSSGEGDQVTGVFDLTSYGILSLVDRVNQNIGEGAIGTDGGEEACGLYAGAAFNPNTRNMDLQVSRMKKKIALGAGFIQTQPVFSAESIDRIAEKTEAIEVPIYLGILPLVSSGNAEFLHNEFPGITIPDPVRKRMADAGKGGEEAGIEIACELMRHAGNRFAGFYIMPPFNRHRVALALLKRMKA